MSINRYQFKRYEIIDECLQSGNIWSKMQLKERVETELGLPYSERNFYGDIKRMKEEIYDAPIETLRGKGYRYTDPDFSIKNQPLSDADKESLKEVIGLLKQFRGFRYFTGAESIIYKIEESINLSDFSEIQLDVVPDYKGIEHMGKLRDAIRGKQVVMIEYAPFNTDTKKYHNLHPYVLKEYNRRWFVFGYNQKLRRNEIYALDRIEDLHTTSLDYKEPDKEELKNYFRDIYGVTNYKARKPEETILRIKSIRAKYVKTKPLHHSQQVIKETPGFTWFKYYLKESPELITWILGFGKDIKVESPLGLVKKIKDNLGKSLEAYGDKSMENA